MNNNRKRLHNQVDPQGDKPLPAGPAMSTRRLRLGASGARVPGEHQAEERAAHRPGGREAPPAPFLDINVTHPHTDMQARGDMTWLS